MLDGVEALLVSSEFDQGVTQRRPQRGPLGVQGDGLLGPDERVGEVVTGVGQGSHARHRCRVGRRLEGQGFPEGALGLRVVAGIRSDPGCFDVGRAQSSPTGGILRLGTDPVLEAGEPLGRCGPCGSGESRREPTGQVRLFTSLLAGSDDGDQPETNQCRPEEGQGL